MLKKTHINVNHHITQEEGDQIVNRMRATKLTQRKLALKTGLKKSAIAAYMKRSMNPSPKIAFHIMEVLDGMGY